MTEQELLLDCVRRLNATGIAYMLTGFSQALLESHHAIRPAARWHCGCRPRAAREVGGKLSPALGRCTVYGIELTFPPLAEKPEAPLQVLVRPARDGKALEFSYIALDALPLESIRLLDESLWVTDAGKGYMAVPVREGLFVPGAFNGTPNPER